MHMYYTVHNIDDGGLYLHSVIDKMETYTSANNIWILVIQKTK